MKKPQPKNHPLVQATSNSSAQLSGRKAESGNQPTFVLHRLSVDDCLVIAAVDQLYPNDPEGIKLPPSVLLKSTTASCWLEAKRKFRYPLTEFQDYLLTGYFKLAA